MTSFLIHGAEGILTGQLGEAARASGSIRVRDGKITAIGVLIPEPGEEIVDAAGCVVTPGLVNSHHHLFQSVLKSVPEGMNEPLTPWLRLVPYSYWDTLDADVMQAGVTLGMAELALSGVTTIADHHYFYSDRFNFDPSTILCETAQRFGVRFMLGRGGATKARAFDSPDIVPLPTESFDAMLRAVEADVSRWHDPDPAAMIKVAFAPTTPTYSLLEGELKEIAQATRAMGVRLHSHLSENQGYVDYTLENYNKRPVHWLAEHDWLGPDVWFAHLVDCDESEVRLLAETGTGMAHCVQANARLGSGVAPADLLHRLGGTVSIGVDGAAANEATDMVSALYATFCAHRITKGVEAVDAETCLHWATAGGAKVLGFENIGTLEVGKDADIALFDLSAPRYLGQHDRLIGPIVAGGQAHIRHSFVKGRPLVVDGALPFLDMDQLSHDCFQAVETIKTRRALKLKEAC